VYKRYVKGGYPIFPLSLQKDGGQALQKDGGQAREKCISYNYCRRRGCRKEDTKLISG